MKTITTKTGKSGATLWYVDGKRVSHDKAVEISFDNGRENLRNLLAPFHFNTGDDASIQISVNGEFGGRYNAAFTFATVETAANAANLLIETLGNEQIHRLTIDNNKSYPNNIRYADKYRHGLVFFNGFEYLNVAETATVTEIDGYDETAFDLLPTVDELNDTDEVKADDEKAEETNATVNLDGTTDINDETIKFFNGKFHSVFSHKYHAAIVDAGCLHHCIYGDGDTEVYDVRGHEVSYDEFITVLTERGGYLPDKTATFDAKADAPAPVEDFDAKNDALKAKAADAQIAVDEAQENLRVAKNELYDLTKKKKHL